MQIFKAVPCLALLVIGLACLGANGEELTKLDADRNDLLKQVTNELSYGHMTLVDAQTCKHQLDQVVSLETAYKEDKGVSLRTISLALEKDRADIKACIHPDKVWMGIDGKNMALRKKIDANFRDKKLTKEQAENLGQQEQTLRSRESVSDTTNGLDYSHAETLAKEIQQLDEKIDNLSNHQ